MAVSLLRGLDRADYRLFLGVAMYYRNHEPPHVHVYYQGYSAIFSIDDARVIRGKFPPTATLIVRQWIVVRREALRMNWARLRRYEPLERIPGPDENDD